MCRYQRADIHQQAILLNLAIHNKEVIHSLAIRRQVIHNKEVIHNLAIPLSKVIPNKEVIHNLAIRPSKAIPNKEVIRPSKAIRRVAILHLEINRKVDILHLEIPHPGIHNSKI